MKNMKLCICMWYDDAIACYADRISKVNKAYCDKHGYDIVISHTHNYPNRAPHWERIPLVLNLLPLYDYVIWVDADAFFYPNAKRLEPIIEKYPNTNIIWSSDWEKVKTSINSGIFIVKNTNYSKLFLEKWASDPTHVCEKYNQSWSHDQGVLRTLYEENVMDVQSNTTIIQRQILQNPNYIDDPDLQPYLCHLCGRDTKSRVTIIDSLLEK